jgi:sugar lactone lactonase YvrE
MPLSQLKIEEPTCVVASGDVCGEGLIWVRDAQSVYWTDINRFLVHRYSPQEGAVKTWFFSEPVTCVMETSRPDTLALSMGSGVALWKPESDQSPATLFALPGWPTVRCNEAGVDPGGALWLGSMRNNVREDGDHGEEGGEDGVLYRIEGNGAATEWRRALGISNTMLWSPGRDKFYFGDSLKNCIWSYDYDLAHRSIGAERPFFQDFERGAPDGSTIDSEGYVWNCRYGGSCVVRIAPDGQIDRVIEMPVSRPTNCTFGGPQGNVLYVTSASPAPGHWERFGGGLFAVQTNVTGLAENKFQLR